MVKSNAKSVVLKWLALQIASVSMAFGLETQNCLTHGHALSHGRLDTKPLVAVAASTVPKCIAACLESADCVSVNYCNTTVSTNTNCELLGQTVCNGCHLATTALCWKHYVIGCLDNVQQNNQMADYKRCYKEGFCQEQCSAWSLAGRKNRTNNQTNGCLFGHTGTSFVTAFLRNFRTNSYIFFGVYISSHSSSRVTYNVTAPRFNSSFLLSGTIEPYQTAIVELPTDLQSSANTRVEEKGILIQSSDQVAVYGYNAQLRSVDTFTVMPRDALGMLHNLVTWPPASFLLVATQDDTTVHVDLRQADALFTFNGTQYQQSILTIELNAYDTFHAFMSTHNTENTDFSGTVISSTKPLVVQTGASRMVYAVRGQELIVDEISPVSTWGKEYVLVNAIHSGLNSFFKIISKDESVSVSLQTGSGVQHYTISGIGSTMMFQLNESSGYLVASEPVGVVLLTASLSNAQVDNAFMAVPPVAMWTHPPLVFTSPVYTAVGNTEELTLVVPARGSNLLLLDGAPLNVSWEPVPGFSSHMWSTFLIGEGNHVISSVNESWPLFAAVYSNGIFASYAFCVGQKYQ